jgi:hypothetical protein
MTFDHDTITAIAAFALLDEEQAMQALRAEADYDFELEEWLEQYVDEQGGDDGDDARYDELHAAAQETPEFEAFCHQVRGEILAYFDVTEEQLELAILLRADDSPELWEEVNRQREELGTGTVRGDL